MLCDISYNAMTTSTMLQQLKVDCFSTAVLLTLPCNAAKFLKLVFDHITEVV